MTNKKFTVGGLFSGVGGLEKAFEDTGYKISWANEIDTNKKLLKNFDAPPPELPKKGDL